MGRLRLRESLVCLAALVAVALGAGCGSGGGDTATAQSAITPAELEFVERDSLLRYQWYLEVEAERAINRTVGLKKMIAADSATGARLKLAAARIPYIHLQPVAHMFGDPAEFRKMEQTFYEKDTTTGLGGAASAFLTDLRQLSQEIKTTDLHPWPIARSTAQLMEDVSTAWIAGKAQPYAGKDLADIAAAVEGAEKAFETVRPALASSDPALVSRLEAQFVEAYELLEEHGGPARQYPTRKKGVGWNFAYSDQIQPDEIQELAASLRGLAELLAEVPDRLPSEDEFAF